MRQWNRLASSNMALRYGKLEADGGAAARGAVNREAAAVLLDDALDD
ncbi:MAG: hypothetical protein Q8R91_08015 [Candidatus Omnitrophota bacterium]|nr:hypothetical protein [Candidatus Omnitrophota bacterium]